jgi:hypothetical protein
VNPGNESSSDPEFALVRPAFDLTFLRPLQRLADAHPKYYISFIFWFLAIPSLACAMFFDGVERGSSSLVLNTCMVVVSLGFLSSRRFGLDRVAVNHVASSFRFVTCSVLLAALVAIHAQQTYNGVLHATQPTALSVLALLFCECALLDCSPHLSKVSQILVSVTSRIPCPHVNFDSVNFLQVGWWMVFGYFSVIEFRRLSKDDLDCFYNIGTFEVCGTMQKLSIYSSLFLLMTQALISRTFVPGMSNFVNASVRRALRASISDSKPRRSPFVFANFHHVAAREPASPAADFVHGF